MRGLENVVNYVYYRGVVDKKRRLGFTLIETVVTIPIALIIILGVGSTFSYTVGQFYNLLQQNAAQTSLLWASYHTQAYFSQAVRVQFVEESDMDIWIEDRMSGGGLNLATDGRIVKDFNSSNINVGNKLSTIAVFYREDDGDITSYRSNDLVGTAVFFKNPSTVVGGSVDPPHGGVLYFSSNTLALTGNSTLRPRLEDTIWYDHLSLFEIMAVECVENPITETNGCDGGTARPWLSADRVKTITFRIRARYFKSTDKSKWIWCTNSGLTQCTPQVSFRDVERIVKVGFRNNILVEASSSFVGSNYDERLHGGLYFFKMSLPKLGF